MDLEFALFIIEWPACLMRDRRIMWALTASTLSGGRTLSGAEHRARVDGGGLWMATMSDVQVSSADQVRAWRAIAAILDGGATPVVLANRDVRFAPWSDSTTTEQIESTNSDDSTCSDDTPYVSDLIVAEVIEDAALRATTLVINMQHGSALQGGEYFSILHDTFSHRIYQIGRVDKLDEYTPTSQAFTVTIAVPAVFSATGHGLVEDQAVRLKTSGALPTGLAELTTYYVIATGLTANAFRLSATQGGAAINTSGTQSGQHSVLSGGIHTLTIRPPLREAVEEGDRVEFDHPKCVMQLATPDAMDLVLEHRSHGQSTVKFIESFPPWPGISED